MVRAVARWLRGALEIRATCQKLSGPANRRRHDMVAGTREIGVQRGDHLGTLADRGGDALDRAGAHVADGEDAGAARLQRMLRRPALLAGAHEALVVQRHRAAREPAGIWIGADEEKQMA